MKNKKQKGYGTMLFVSTIFMVIICYFGYMLVTAKGIYSKGEGVQYSEQVLTNTLPNVENYYLSYSNDIIRNEFNTDAAKINLKSQLSPDAILSNVKIGISNVIYVDNLSWRDIHLWIPAKDGIDGSEYNPSTNIFKKGNKDVVHVVFSGRVVEAKKLYKAINQLKNIENALKVAALNKTLNSPVSEMNNNYFNGCSNSNIEVKRTSLYCVSNFTNLYDMNISGLTGLSKLDLLTPWGTQVQGLNQEVDVVVNDKTYTLKPNSKPYTMAISIRLPNNTRVTKIISQPVSN